MTSFPFVIIIIIIAIIVMDNYSMALMSSTDIILWRIYQKRWNGGSWRRLEWNDFAATSNFVVIFILNLIKRFSALSTTFHFLEDLIVFIILRVVFRNSIFHFISNTIRGVNREIASFNSVGFEFHNDNNANIIMKCILKCESNSEANNLYDRNCRV